MKKSTILMIALTASATFFSCKKESSTPSAPATPAPVTQPPSKMAMLNHIWILKETFENGVQKTSNGTGRYEFNKYGNFRAEFNGTFQDIGTYKFTTKDSNELKVTLMGSPSPYYWKLLKLDEKSLNTEFMSGTTKNNYNYSR